MTTYVLFAIACAGLAWLATLHFSLLRRVEDLETLVNQQRTSAELLQLRQSVSELLNELKHTAVETAQVAMTEQGRQKGPTTEPSRPANQNVASELLSVLAEHRSSPARPPVGLPVDEEPADKSSSWTTPSEAGADLESAKSQTLLRLAQEGLSHREIARQMRMESGEVELALSIAKNDLSPRLAEPGNNLTQRSRIRKEAKSKLP